MASSFPRIRKLCRGTCFRFADPDSPFPHAEILWSPAHSASVLPVEVLPPIGGSPPSFAIADVRCRTAIVETPDGLQHVLFTSAGARLQLVVRGASILAPVRLRTDAILPARGIERRLHLLRQLTALALKGDLDPHLHPPDPRARRLALVLRALDAHLAGATQREVAALLFPPARVAASWSDPRRHLRDTVRRAIRRGRWLMEEGYRCLLT